MSDFERLQGLARLISVELGKATPRPKLRLVTRGELAQDQAPEPEDSVMREHRIARVRWLARHYGLDVIIRQHTYGRSGIDALDSAELVDLHRDMERAFDCVIEGIPIDEAGLIRSREA